MRRVNLTVACACVAVLAMAMAAASVQATTIPIDIVNPGFDADTTTSYVNCPPGAVATGWTMTGTGSTQCAYQKGPVGGLSALSGANIGQLSNAGHAATGFAQLLEIGTSALQVAAGDTIQISVYQGKRNDYQTGNTEQFDIRIWRDALPTGAGTMAFDSGSFASPALGVWQLDTTTYTATAADVGHNLYVELWNATTNGTQVTIDSVTATYTSNTTTPEPGTLALLAAGLAGLLCYAWRKRK